LANSKDDQGDLDWCISARIQSACLYTPDLPQPDNAALGWFVIPFCELRTV